MPSAHQPSDPNTHLRRPIIARLSPRKHCIGYMNLIVNKTSHLLGVKRKFQATLKSASFYQQGF
jgi:hypothetical protein